MRSAIIIFSLWILYSLGLPLCAVPGARVGSSSGSGELEFKRDLLTESARFKLQILAQALRPVLVLALALYRATSHGPRGRRTRGQGCGVRTGVRVYYVWVSPGSAYHRRIVCGLCGAAERAISGIWEFGVWHLGTAPGARRVGVSRARGRGRGRGAR